MDGLTLFEKALERLREKFTAWKKTLAVEAGVELEDVDAMLANRNERVISALYRLTGYGGKALLANTSVKKMISVVIESGAKSKRLFFVVAFTGAGKTYTSQAVVQNLSDEYSVGYVRVTEMNGRSRLSLWNDIARAFPQMHVFRDGDRIGSLVYTRVRDMFKNTHGVIVIDEAQKLSDKNLESLRDLFDTTDVSLVFMASSQFYERMSVERLDNNDFGQFLRRADDKYILAHATPGDVKAYLSLYGVSLEDGEYKIISKMVSKHGDIDTLARSIRRIASLHDEGKLKWSKVKAGDIFDAINRVMQVQRIDNNSLEEAA